MVNDILLEKKKNSLYFKRINSKKEILLNDDCDGYFINAKEEECRKIVSFLKSKNIKKEIAIMSKNELTNRRLVETLNFQYLVSPEINDGKDTLKQRSSGLNHVVLKEAQKKNITILISIDELLKKDKKEQIILISRIIQNIKLTRKTKTEIKIANLSSEELLDEKQRKTLGFSWGMSSNQVATSTSFEKI